MPRFNGAAPMMERKTASAVIVESLHRRFNGAAPMMERKTARPPGPCPITGCAMLRERLPLANQRRSLESANA